MCQSLYPYGKNSTHLFDLGGYRSHIGATSVSSNLAQLKLPQHLQAKNVYLKLYLEFFFLIGIHSMQGQTATTRHGVTRKRSTKRLKHTRNLFRKNLQIIGVC